MTCLTRSSQYLAKDGKMDGWALSYFVTLIEFNRFLRFSILNLLKWNMTIHQLSVSLQKLPECF